jgi:cytidylate kinase
MTIPPVRVITIDGPSGSGKGTIGQLLAARFGWRFLDSGALYRVLGIAVLRHGLGEGAAELAQLARTLDVTFEGDTIVLDGADVTAEIRTEVAGNMASRVAALPEVRVALLARQRAFARPPGLVADGRDMGTVVFPAAQVKIFLTASPEECAKRRYKQLKEKGFDASLSDLAAALRERDERDRNRSVAPLKAAAAALEVESSRRSVEEVLSQVLERVFATFPDLRP